MGCHSQDIGYLMLENDDDHDFDKLRPGESKLTIN
jgi:hypothetical protein